MTLTGNSSCEIQTFRPERGLTQLVWLFKFNVLSLLFFDLSYPKCISRHVT